MVKYTYIKFTISGIQCVHSVVWLLSLQITVWLQCDTVTQWLCVTAEQLHHPRRKPCTQQQSLSVPPAPQPLATTNLPSLCMDFSLLDVSYKWSHTICGLLWLALFTEHHFLKKYLFIYWLRQVLVAAHGIFRWLSSWGAGLVAPRHVGS